MIVIFWKIFTAVIFQKKMTKNSGIIETKNVKKIRTPRQFSSDQPGGLSFLYYTQAWNVMEN